MNRSFICIVKKRFQSTTTIPPKVNTPPPPLPPSKSSAAPWIAVTLTAGLGLGWYYKDSIFPPSPLDYQAVYNDIADILENTDYDDGSYGPVLIRLAWHASGTYNALSKNGGSNGASMRFSPESGHGANAGLSVARDLLEKIKEKHPRISYADLWTLAGVVAVQEMGGPTIPWRPGREDAVSSQACPPEGRLPAADANGNGLKSTFKDMGLTDKEMVALAGAHALGRCHTDRSGYDGPWTHSPTTFSNGYFKELYDQRWIEKKWNGPKQYVDKKTGSLMMLPADLAIRDDKSLSPFAKQYAKDEKLFFNDFANAYSKLLELGVPFTAEQSHLELKRV